jgi:hypothetical protein
MNPAQRESPPDYVAIIVTVVINVPVTKRVLKLCSNLDINGLDM